MGVIRLQELQYLLYNVVYLIINSSHEQFLSSILSISNINRALVL